MRSRASCLLAAAAMLAVGSIHLQAQSAQKSTWATAGNSAFAPTLMYGFARIAIGPDGALWAMVNGKTTNGNLEVYNLPRDAKQWTKVGRGFVFEDAYFGGIAVDTAGTPWLACKAGLYFLQGKKWVPTYAGTYWTANEKQYAKQYDLGDSCSIVAGQDGAVYAANDYYAGVFERNPELAAKEWDSTVYDASRQVSFFPIGADKSEYGVGYKATPNNAATPSLVWAGGALYLAYDEYHLTQHWGFHVGKWNGSGWADLGEFGSSEAATGGYSEGAADDLAVAVSKSGKVFVAYREGSGASADRQWKLSAMMFNGTDDWTDMGTKGFTAHTVEAFPLSAAFDSKETPYVCFADEVAGTVNVVKFDGKKWTAVGGVVAEGAAPSMIIGPDDTLYVAYREKGGTGSITVRKLKL